ncbi:unnamed protein product, partial [marine sediment metagenome]
IGLAVAGAALSAVQYLAGKTKHVVTQVQVHDDATQGEQADETFTFAYDEI